MINNTDALFRIFTESGGCSAAEQLEGVFTEGCHHQVSSSVGQWQGAH
jgi:hypothetical protein